MRLSDVGYGNLARLGEKFGVSIRGVFEAATTICLEDEEDPERHAATVKLWDVARRLDRAQPFRRGERRRVMFFMEDELFAGFQAACRRFGVSQNAALSLVVTPWPEEDTTDFHRYRTENLHRIIERARRLDFLRRGGKRQANSISAGTLT